MSCSIKSGPFRNADHWASAGSLRCRICHSAQLRPAGSVGGYSFVECTDCCFVFAPAITSATMEALYAGGYHGPQEGAPETGWADMRFLQPALGRLPQRPLAILDFGCGQSLVPELLRNQGHRVMAVDITAPVRPHPDRLTGKLEHLDLSSRCFDLVYAFQVFEHLPEPRATFERLIDLTRPGGLVLIHTDMQTPEREGGLEAWWYVSPPDHCAFFRPRTFAALLSGSDHGIVWHDPKTVLIQAGSDRKALEISKVRLHPRMGALSEACDEVEPD